MQNSLVEAMCVGVKNQAPCPFTLPGRVEKIGHRRPSISSGLTLKFVVLKVVCHPQECKRKKTYQAAPSLKQPPLSAFGYAKRSSSFHFKALESNERT